MLKFLTALLIAASLLVLPGATSAAPTPTAATPCVAGPNTTYHHVLVWMLENHS